MYVDDFIYFSTDPTVEQAFEHMLPTKTNLQVDFNGPIHHSLGVKFTHTKHEDGNLTIHLSQEADVYQLLQDTKMHTSTTVTKPTPYQSGHPVDSVPHADISSQQRIEIETQLCTILGSLNWLSTQTRPDIATITNLIAQYQSEPSPGHLEAAKYILRYLKGTAELGISFTSFPQSSLQSFVKFPIDPNRIHPFSDANWGPQDASVPKQNAPPQEIDLFKSRSISGFLLWLGGPLHWISKRQSITARSSTEAKIYAVDECTKCLQHVTNILSDLHLLHLFTNNEPIPIMNNNEAAVKWLHNMTTRGLRHIQMRENAVREQVQRNFITVEHIGGKHNLADPFTKEEKDNEHFITCRDLLLTPPLTNSKQNSYPHTNGQKDSDTINVHANDVKSLVLSSSRLIRDVADIQQRASSFSLTRQARGVLSYVRRTVDQTL
jgi:Reverse transcriptase (RNA-dependent DNA polymerase).